MTDSILELTDFSHGPTLSDAERARTLRHRSARIRASAARVRYEGLDLTQLAEGHGLRMRKLELDSGSLDVLSDKRLPPARHRRPRLTPQEWIAELDQGVEIDTVIVRKGSIIYRELQPERVAPGVFAFADIEAIASHVHHQPDSPDHEHPMRLLVTTRLMDEALLRADFRVPLDSRQFDLSVQGTVGPMDVTGLNRFMERVEPLQIKSGRLDSLRFRIVVRSGAARGSVVPLYRDLALDVTGDGAEGILGAKGVIGSIARGVAEVAVNQFGVRHENPDGDEAPLSGRIHHVFRADETLPAFLWKAIRDGLGQVIKKKGEPEAASRR